MKVAVPFAILMTIGVIGYATLQFVPLDIVLANESTEDLVTRLSKSEAALNSVYENLDSLSPESAVKQSVSELAQIDANYESLGKHELDTSAERSVQMTVMRSYYLAQAMLPETKPSFQSQAERVIELRPETEDAAIARVLLFCSKHDLKSKADRDLLREVAKEAQGYGSKSYGVGLYSIVAHEFWKNGEATSAEKVLETGISHYQGCQEKIKLVHQMIDQGHRDPPKPKMTQAQFKRMQRALANVSTGKKKAVTFRS